MVKEAHGFLAQWRKKTQVLSTPVNMIRTGHSLLNVARAEWPHNLEQPLPVNCEKKAQPAYGRNVLLRHLQFVRHHQSILADMLEVMKVCSFLGKIFGKKEKDSLARDDEESTVLSDCREVKGSICFL